MGNLRRYYYENKAKIWKVILIIAFILLLIRFTDYMIGIKNNDKTITNNNTNIINSIVDNSSLTTNKSTIDGATINENTLKIQVNIIEQFLELCNKKQFEEAYRLLSNDCKESLFTTIDIFKKTYCNNLFSNYKKYTIENWSGSTYKVRITEDPIATGNVSENMANQDYITIVNEKGNNKLNINNYIGRKEINASKTINNITIDVIYSDTFFDYENYTIKVKNNTDKTIYLDNGEDTSTIYIQDSNGLKYEAASSEIIWSTLKIPAGSTVVYKIKYTNTYKTNRKIKKLVFNNLILDYNEYLKDMKNYKNKIEFTVEF